MKTCPDCKRHVRNRDAACPFCGARLRETSAWPAVVGLVVAAGCGPAVEVGTDSDAATTSGGSGPMTSTMPSSSSSSSTATASATAATTMPLSTTGGTTDGSTTEDFTSAGFIYGGATTGPVDIECDVWSQDCPEGEKCMPWANDGGDQWNATRCSPVDDAAAGPGEPCEVEGSALSGVDHCDETSMCFYVDPKTNTGVCMPFCAGSEAAPVCDDASTTCAITNEGVIALCLPTCDPLGDDCGALQGCWGYTDFFCFPDHSEEPSAYGDDCDALNDCDPGFVCVNTEFVPGCADPGCCTPYCNLGDPDPDSTCPGYAEGQTCAPFFDSPPPLYENVGVCAIVE